MDSRLTLSSMDDKYIIYSEGAQIKSGVENGGLTLERIKAFDAQWLPFPSVHYYCHYQRHL